MPIHSLARQIAPEIPWRSTITPMAEMMALAVKANSKRSGKTDPGRTDRLNKGKYMATNRNPVGNNVVGNNIVGDILGGMTAMLVALPSSIAFGVLAYS